MKTVFFLLILGTGYSCFGATSEPGLLFYLSGDHEFTADYAEGNPQPNFLRDVKIIQDGAKGRGFECAGTQLMSYWAPGNIYAERGTLTFDWRSREPVGPTPFPIFRVAYADHSSWDMVWLRIDYNGRGGFDAFVTDINLARIRISYVMPVFPKPTEWVHLALAWDETRGIRFYVNGVLAAKQDTQAVVYAGLDQFCPHSRMISPLQVQSAYNFIRGGDIDEIRIYDRMLADENVSSLARGITPTKIPELVRNVDQRQWRDEWWLRYGWNRKGDTPPYLEARQTSVRKVEIHDVYDLKRWWWKGTDGIRETTWPGVFNRSRPGPMTSARIAPTVVAIPAFPGAEGFGSTTPGGRGGKVIFVTNLNDSGPGSFRDACEAEGPRMVVFRVSGLITLARDIVVRNPYLTIAGQSAPGDGICLRNYTFVIATHDVVVRYLRSRLGDLSGQQADSITLAAGAHNVILDHCSASWSVDEGLSLAGKVSNVTIQWCLIAEALNHSKHTKGPHGYGSLSRANGPVTWHHNLWAHNNARNPRLGDDYGRPPYPIFDVRNNVIYDYGEIASGLTQGVLKVNYVGNYIRPGPSSKASTPIHIGGPSDLIFFIRANVFEGNSSLTTDNSHFFDPITIDGKRQVQTVEKEFVAEPVKTTTALEAFGSVLSTVGTSLPHRDSVDARVIDEVRKRGGSLIDSQQQVGGWPELKSEVALTDSDADGMPDLWERRHGLNPHDPRDGAADKDKDGYTNLEEYLNNTNPTK